MGRDGDPVRSFGRFYDSENRLVVSDFSRSVIACMDELDLLMVAPNLLPEVRAYRPDGQIVWRSSLEAYDPIMYVEGPNGGTTEGLPRDRRQVGFEYALSFVPFGEQYALLQLARRDSTSFAEGLEYAAITTYLLDARTGQGVEVGEELPEIRFATPELLLGLVHEPYPQMVEYALRTGSHTVTTSTTGHTVEEENGNEGG